MVRRTGTTPVRTIRIPDDLWQAALRTARQRGEDVPDAIRDFLARYARDELRATRTSKPTEDQP